MKTHQYFSVATHLKVVFILFASTAITGCQKDFEKVSAINSDNTSNATTTNPNIVLILADDIGYEIPTCNGGQSYQTPNLDLMAKNGMRFTQCQASPMCSPSRFMLLTGKYNFRNYTEWGKMDLSQQTIANMLKSAGYDTYTLGKWQFDNGDQAVKTFGFSNHYAIFDPFAVGGTNSGGGEGVGHYKSPKLYINGSYVDEALTKDKYCDDILTDSLVNYARASKQAQKPFFIYYAMGLCHSPFSPTPDDPEYKNWDPTSKVSDVSFFPSMVKYMDKKIGQIISRFDSMNLTQNTVFIFLGDNGTPPQITSQFNGTTIKGGKGSTTIYGTHVPLLIYWKGTVASNKINNDLIDFTDFLPTIADIATTPVPTTYGKLDGVSFYPRLLGNSGTPRDWVFCHFDPQHKNDKPLKRFIQNVTYKLYDSTGLFYNIINDPKEKKALLSSGLTADEKQLKSNFQSIMNTLH